MNEKITHQALQDFTFEELENRLREDGINPVHTKALWRAMYRDDKNLLEQKDDFSPPLKRWLEAHVEHTFHHENLAVEAETHSSDGLTVKYLLRLRDGQTVETVLMGYEGRFTACVSSQVGCAMGCVFCATGQMGFTRHLRPSEIVAQLVHLNRELKKKHGKRLRNLVLMGMGEPLHNYDSVLHALDIISNNRGINIGASKISISTVGVVPGIRRLADESRPYNLAVSLHGANEAQRAALIPVAKKWNYQMLLDACRYYVNNTGKRIFFEWTLIEGVNDSPDVARELADVLEGIDAHINLIPLNPTHGYEGQPTQSASAKAFQKILHEKKIPNTIRQRRGIDVAAGCGQLKVSKATS